MQYVISLDIGGTNLRAAIINDKYQIVNSLRRSTIVGSVDLFLKQVAEIITDLDYKKYNPIAISMGVPGRVRSNGFIDALPNIHIENIPLREYVEYYFKIPAMVRNDAEMAGLAEAAIGQGKNLYSTFFITISTGVGGAYIQDRKICQYSNEIGHTLVHYHNYYYELEKIASGSGIINLCRLNGIEIERTSQFFERIRLRDTAIFPVFNDWLDILDSFFTDIVAAFSPSIIVLTGGVMKSADVFLDELIRRHPEVIIKPAGFDQDAGLIGGAAFGFLNKGSANK